MNRINLLGGLLGHERKGGGFRTGYLVYGADGISPALNTMQGGGREPHIVAMRGRNPENPGRGRMGLKQSRDWR